MLRQRMLIGWVLAIGLAGCGLSPTGPDLVQRLVGEWLWVDATGGSAGETLTPDSEGYDQSLRFYGSGDVELFRDGVSQARTAFTYSVGVDGASEHINYGEGPFGFPSSLVELTPGDTLLLIDPCCDGFVRRWIRFPLGD